MNVSKNKCVKYEELGCLDFVNYPQKGEYQLQGAKFAYPYQLI